ncbi:unnamed protein product [Camellia sinensis]
MVVFFDQAFFYCDVCCQGRKPTFYLEDPLVDFVELAQFGGSSKQFCGVFAEKDAKRKQNASFSIVKLIPSLPRISLEEEEKRCEKAEANRKSAKGSNSKNRKMAVPRKLERDGVGCALPVEAPPQ